MITEEEKLKRAQHFLETISFNFKDPYSERFRCSNGFGMKTWEGLKQVLIRIMHDEDYKLEE